MYLIISTLFHRNVLHESDMELFSCIVFYEVVSDENSVRHIKQQALRLEWLGHIMRRPQTEMIK